MADFFQIVRLREEFFPLINPMFTAVRVHKQVVYSCKNHSWELGGPAAQLRRGAARPGAKRRRPVASAAHRGCPNPATLGSAALGAVITRLECKYLCKTSANPKQRRRTHPSLVGAWSSFLIPRNSRKTLPKCIFTVFQNQRENRKKNVNLPHLPQYYILSVLLTLLILPLVLQPFLPSCQKPFQTSCGLKKNFFFN